MLLFMGLPDKFYLRRKNAALGPFLLETVEVLYKREIVDASTPISEGGNLFRTIAEWPELLTHLSPPAPTETAPDRWALPETTDLPPTPFPQSGGPTLLSEFLERAARRSLGTLKLETSEGAVSVWYKDGAIVWVDPDPPRLGFQQFLLDKKEVTPEALRAAEEKAPEVGGHWGAALVTLGSIAPHTYFEKAGEWAKGVLRELLTFHLEEARFEDEEEPSAAPVPLTFDRFGVLMELVRLTHSEDALRTKLAPIWHAPIARGEAQDLVAIEDLKLKAQEIRTFHAVDGNKTLANLLDAQGGAPKARSILEAIYLGQQTKLVCFLPSQDREEDLLRARKIDALYQNFKKMNYLEILGVNARHTDADVRRRFADLAKRYHPDALEEHSAPELQAATASLFALFQEAFAAIKDEDDRYKYILAIDQGLQNQEQSEDDRKKEVEAEVTFKKAKVLMKVRKYEEALEELEHATNLKPDEPEFRLYQIFAGYLLASKTMNPQECAKRAIPRILEIVRANHDIAAGHLFLGRLYKKTGSPKKALNAFEEVLEFDPSHAEAKQEVRVVKSSLSRKRRRP